MLRIFEGRKALKAYLGDLLIPGFAIEKYGIGADANSVDGNFGGKDVKRTHRWRLYKFGEIDSKPIISTEEALFAKSISMPSISFEEIQVMGASTVYKFASKPSFGDLTIAFYDLIGLEPKIRKWQTKVWNEVSGIGVANDYKSEVRLYLTDGMGKAVDDEWIFMNAWPKSINHGELIYDSSEFKLLTIVISYDWIEYKKAEGVSQPSTPDAPRGEPLASANYTPGPRLPSAGPSQLEQSSPDYRILD